jgi:hypothetical protein
MIKFQANKGAEGTLKDRGKHGRRDQQTGSQKFDVTESFHGFRNVVTQTQSHAGQKEKGFQEWRKAVAEYILGVNAKMPEPDAKQTPVQGRIHMGITGGH